MLGANIQYLKDSNLLCRDAYDTSEELAAVEDLDSDSEAMLEAYAAGDDLDEDGSDKGL